MRKLLAIGAVTLTLGGPRFAAFSAHTGGSAHQVAALSGPDGSTCGGAVSTWRQILQGCGLSNRIR